MKNELRKQRETLIFNLYQKEIFDHIDQHFEPSFESDENMALYTSILEHLDEIDDVIESQLYNYSLKRISYVDRAIIRYATYEMMFTELPVEIILDEAVEITKEYTNMDDGKQHKFSNKVLDNIKKILKG